MVSLRRLAWLASILMCACLLHIASANAAGSKRLALVIGNDGYKYVEPLTNARNDAKLFAGVLKHAGFDVTTVNDVNRTEFWTALDTFKNRINKGDEVVFFYAGHGVQIASNQLLLPVDIKAQNDGQVQRDGVSLVDVQDALKDARFAMFVIDACRDNPFPKQGTRSIGSTRGLLPPEPATGQVIIMSAGRNQRALDAVPGENVKNGLFTYELAQVLQQPGVEIRTALERVKETVDDVAKKVNHEQRPSLVNDLRGDFYFMGVTTVQVQQIQSGSGGQARSKDQIEDEFWDGIKGTNDAASFDLYLKSYPAGRYVALAQLAANKAKTGAMKGQSTNISASTGDQDMNPGKVFRDCADCPEMVVIPAGSFMMGSDLFNTMALPIHNVAIKSFAAGRFAVTKGQFATFVKALSYVTEGEKADGCTGWTGKQMKRDRIYNWRNVGYSQADDHPVVCITWNDAQAYIGWLTQITGKKYRLFSESEREYAARAGSTGNYWWGEIVNREYANYGDKLAGPFQEKFTTPGGKYPANPFGLYDMNGNSSDWVEDVRHDNYAGAPLDGGAWVSGGDSQYRVYRGGSWFDNGFLLRSATRDWTGSNDRHLAIGFRVARSLDTQ